MIEIALIVVGVIAIGGVIINTVSAEKRKADLMSLIAKHNATAFNMVRMVYWYGMMGDLDKARVEMTLVEDELSKAVTAGMDPEAVSRFYAIVDAFKTPSIKV